MTSHIICFFGTVYLIMMKGFNFLNLSLFLRYNMPHTPLSRPRPVEFPRVRDEENAFDSSDEDTDGEETQDEEELLLSNEEEPLL